MSEPDEEFICSHMFVRDLSQSADYGQDIVDSEVEIVENVLCLTCLLTTSSILSSGIMNHWPNAQQ